MIIRVGRDEQCCGVVMLWVVWSGDEVYWMSVRAVEKS